MNKEFIPYEQALALKELGFDEPCFMSYRGKFDLYRNGMGGYLSEMTMERNSDLDKYEINKTEQYWISAPTFSQSFRWFREKYGLVGWVEGNNGKRIFMYRIESPIDSDDQLNCYPFRTYEEAELACINKLIEIVKDGTKINTRED